MTEALTFPLNKQKMNFDPPRYSEELTKELETEKTFYEEVFLYETATYDITDASGAAISATTTMEGKLVVSPDPTADQKVVVTLNTTIPDASA